MPVKFLSDEQIHDSGRPGIGRLRDTAQATSKPAGNRPARRPATGLSALSSGTASGTIPGWAAPPVIRPPTATPIAATFPIEQIRDAVTLQSGGHVHGKVVVTL